MIRTAFHTAVDGGGLADTWHIFSLADHYRVALAGEPQVDLNGLVGPLIDPDHMALAIVEHGYDPDALLPRFQDAWARRPPAQDFGWRVWYPDQVVTGQTREDWLALPDDGILGVVVDCPGLSYATLRARLISAGHERYMLQSRDPYWWDDEHGHPRDETVQVRPALADPALAKRGAYCANPMMAALRCAWIASPNWRVPEEDWRAWWPRG